MKTCFKCRETKPLTEFYWHSRMADGHLNKCISCVKKYVNKYRQKNIEYILAYDRERGQDPKRQAANRRRYRERIATKEGREREWKRSAKYRKNRPLERAANLLVQHAIKRGDLVRKSCSKCGARKADAHHEDYTKPLEVTWLCKACHGRRHREINENKRNGIDA